MTPNLLFGTASFGMDGTQFSDVESVRHILKTLRDLGIGRLDSGARYPPLNPGRAEELIGETEDLGRSFVTDTKVYTDTTKDGSGDLTDEAIEKSAGASLKRLRADQVNILHIHRADPSTPLEEQIKAFNQQIQLGRCQAWGVSNVSPEMLQKMLHICEEKGLQKPSSYQGDYNVVTRGMEAKLLPILRKHGMVFNAFRPLAGGFLTGKFVNNDTAGTRFGDENPLSKFVQKIFGAEDLHAAMKNFDSQVKSQGLTPVEVAIRWLAHHSALNDEDGIILGASRAEQVIQTVGMIRKGPLPAEILKEVKVLWDELKSSRGDII